MINITPLRNEILSIFKENNNSLKAYDVIDILSKTKPSIKPNTVYRILNLLVENGILHKIQSSNIFTMCNNNSSHHDHSVKHIILTCSKCLKVEELEDHNMLHQLDNFYKKNNFNLKHHIYELSGHCNLCKVD